MKAFFSIHHHCCYSGSSIRYFSSLPSSIRLSKWLSENLVVSRKEAERCIRAGLVRIAGSPVPSAAALVSPDQLSSLTVKGKKVNPLHPTTPGKKTNDSSTAITLWLIHKRRGELVTHSDPRDRPVVQSPIPNGIFVGRLDMNTEGLLLCTNSGMYARELELPAHQYHRMYRVRVHGKLDNKKLKALERGIRVDEKTRYSAMKVVAETKKSSHATNQWLQITCCEGKNRQIRNALGHLGLTVSRLIRTSFGDYELGKIPPGGMIQAPKRLTHRRKGPLVRITRLSSSKQNVVTRQPPPQPSALAPQIRWVKA